MATLALAIGAEEERLRKEAEEAERRRKEAEEAERRRKEAEEAERRRKEAEEERRRKEAEEERIKQERMATLALVIGAEETRRRREAEEERIKQERMATFALVIGAEEERRRRDEEKITAILSVVLASMSKDKNSRLFDYINVLFIKNFESLSTIINNAKKILFYYICYNSVNIYIASYFTTAKDEEKTLLKTYIELKNKINKLKELKELQSNKENIKTLVSDARTDFYDIPKQKTDRKDKRTDKAAANSFLSNITKFQEYYIKQISGYADYIDYITKISDELFIAQNSKLVENCKNCSTYVRSLVDYEQSILKDIQNGVTEDIVKKANEIGSKLIKSVTNNYLVRRLKTLINIYNKINNTKNNFYKVCKIDNNLILDNNTKNNQFDNYEIKTNCRKYIGIDNGGTDIIWYVDLFKFLNDNFMAQTLDLDTKIDTFITSKIKPENRKTLVINTNDKVYDKQQFTTDLDNVNNSYENINNYLINLNILKNHFLLNIMSLKDQIFENNDNNNITELLEIKQKIKEKLKSDKTIGTGFDLKKYDNYDNDNVYCETHTDDINTTKELEKIGLSQTQYELSPYLQHIYEKCFPDSKKDEDKLFKNNFHFLMIVPHIRKKIFDSMSPDLKECIIKKINESLDQYNVNDNNDNDNDNDNDSDSEFILNNKANINNLNLTITDNNIYDLQNIFDDIKSKIPEIEEKSSSISIVNNNQGQVEGVDINSVVQKQKPVNNLRA